jgi:hypothetical protein
VEWAISFRRRRCLHLSSPLRIIQRLLNDPAISRALVLDVILEEIAQTQKRALRDRVIVEPCPLWVMDRNFCVRTLLFRLLGLGLRWLAVSRAVMGGYEGTSAFENWRGARWSLRGNRADFALASSRMGL